MSEQRSDSAASAALMAVCFEAAEEGIAIHDDGVIVDANPALARLFGYPPDELPGKHSRELTTPETFENLKQNFGAGYPDHVEGTGRRRDGTNFPIHVFNKEVRYQGRDLHAAVVRDTSELQRALEARDESEDRFKRLFAGAQDAVFLLALDGTFLGANAAAAQLIGYDEHEIVGRSFAELNLISPDQQQQVVESLGQGLASIEATPGSFNMRRPDGEQVEVEVSSHALVYNNQTVLLGIVRDITERRRAEERQAQLEEQLHQSQKMEAIGRLAGGIAHDFNNFLGAILGLCELQLLDLPEDDPARGDLEQIMKAGDRAAGLTRQLLAFGRRQVLRPEIININATIRDLEKMLRRLLGEDVELETQLEPALGTVEVDPSQLQQVIVNLAVNARDAMLRGGRLVIKTQNVEAAEGSEDESIPLTLGEYVMVTVTDTGHGIAEEHREQIFEPFFTTKPVGRGTGLGLSTVYGIVKQSGGEIGLDSEVDRGTTFRVYLPRISRAASSPGIEVSPEAWPRGDETVLVVEDELMVRRIITRVLERQGYQVREAPNGEEALRLVDELGPEQIQLLLTDVVMPKLGGVELAERLLELEPALRVLFMSGHRDSMVFEHAGVDPERNYLAKPFSPGVLAHKVREVLDA